MLASSFLSAEQLGLSTKQHQALVGVLGMLERGELRHVPPNLTGYDDEDYVGVGFNMGTFGCGSVHCIGGWADRLYGTDFHTVTCSMKLHDRQWVGLYELLYGTLESEVELEDITVAQAAEALRNFLTTGNAHWLQVLGE